MKKVLGFVLFAVIALVLSSCTLDRPIVTLSLQNITIGSEDVEIVFDAVDERSTSLTYKVYLDSIEILNGTMQSGQEVRIPYTLPYREDMLIRVEVIDEANNIGSKEIWVSVTDTRAPTIRTLDIVEQQLSSMQYNRVDVHISPIPCPITHIKQTVHNENVNKTYVVINHTFSSGRFDGTYISRDNITWINIVLTCHDYTINNIRTNYTFDYMLTKDNFTAYHTLGANINEVKAQSYYNWYYNY